MLYPGVFVGADVEIGRDCVLHPNVAVRDGCRIGDRVILHAGVVIGSDGFGYAGRGESRVKIPQVGIVVIEDDVEIGANTTVDRATLGQTVIRRGAKIDNLVQIAHNVIIGEHSVVAAQAGIAGSTKVGKHVTHRRPGGHRQSCGNRRRGDDRSAVRHSKVGAARGDFVRRYRRGAAS